MRGRRPVVVALMTALLAAAAVGGDSPPPEFGGRTAERWADAFADRSTRADAKSRLFGGEGAAVPVLVALARDARAEVADEAKWIVRTLGLRIVDELATAGADDLLADVWDRRAIEAAKAPRGFRIETPKRAPVPPESLSAAWESGNGHGFCLEFCRGRWTPDGFVVDRISWSAPRDGPDGGTTVLASGTVPAVRARAAIAAVLRLTTLQLAAVPGESPESGSTSMDFHVRTELRRGATAVAAASYTGYAGETGRSKWFAVEPAVSKVLRPMCGGVEFRPRPPTEADREWLRGRLVASKDDAWWVRERLLHVVAALGDRSFDAALRDVIRAPLEDVRRRHRYAIDAYAKLVGPDLRPTPFRDEDVEPVRAKYLARWDP